MQIRRMKTLRASEKPVSREILVPDLRSSERVMEYLLAEFDRPERKHGSRLPGVRQIAKHLHVSVPTVHRAFQKLAQEGRIRTEIGSGTYLVTKAAKRTEGLSFALSFQLPPPGLTQAWAYLIYGGILHGASHAKPPITLKPIARQEEAIDYIVEQILDQRSSVDGLILFPAGNAALNEKIRQAYESSGKPVVNLNNPWMTTTANFVSPDYFSASNQLGRAWRGTGRKRVLLMLGDMLHGSVSGQLRMTGLLSGLEVDADNAIEYRMCVTKNTRVDGGRDAMRDVIESQKWIPDAVYCAGDRLALGTFHVLTERGLRVPDDVSVVGGTGLDLSDSAIPRLTRTKQPFEQLGKELVAMLRQRIEQNGASLPGRILPSPWIGGATTRPEENALLEMDPQPNEE